jgi:hypothetical protein
MKTTKKLFCAMAIFFLIVGTLGTALATTESLNIEPGKELVRNIEVASNDKVQLTFLGIAQTSNNLRFSIVFPNSTVNDFGEINQFSTSFSSETAGICEMHFDNTNSSEAVLLSLNYEITHYILGMPEMIFLLAAITVLLVVIVGGYIIMGKYA